eukprot:CAMPEP_0184647674 /NCGR_PEP_ID=MMETSP0308-20130426/4664_1 /TAXON_ID=38269 /ORGANISM="Gloeochaete witrockiana, Strain SAG 46.84" /LENGTH=648 /DNA_ID=CAMNT_0027078865 /DNA_START=97 /DNA_END=2043 /DNA_ORIENTATION=+
MGRRRRLVFFGLSVIIILFSISAISTHTRTSSAKTNQSRLQALQLVTKKRTPSDRVTFSLLTTIRDFDEWHFEQASGSEHRVFAEQYLNSFQTWTALVAPSQVVVLVELQSTCNFLQKRFPGISCVAKDCSHPEFGLPTLSCVFAHLFPFVSEDVVVWVNGDILLFDDFDKMVNVVFGPNSKFSQPVVVGQRTDFGLTRYMNLSSWEARDSLFKSASNGVLHGEYGIDYFVARKSAFGKFEMLPLLLGTHRWDNWLLSQYLVQNEMTVIDATNAVRVVHQDSDEKGTSHQRVGSQWNQQLVEGHSSKRYRLGSTLRAPYYLANDKEGYLNILRNDSCQCAVFAHQRALRKAASQSWRVVLLYVQSADEIPLAMNWLCSVRDISFKAFFVVARDEHVRSLLVTDTDLKIDQIALSTNLAACIADVLTNQVEVFVTRPTGIWLGDPFYDVPSVIANGSNAANSLDEDKNGNRSGASNLLDSKECSILRFPEENAKLPMFLVRSTSESRYLWHCTSSCMMKNQQQEANEIGANEFFFVWESMSECIQSTALKLKSNLCPFPRASTFDSLSKNETQHVHERVESMWMDPDLKKQLRHKESVPGSSLKNALIYMQYRTNFKDCVNLLKEQKLWLLDDDSIQCRMPPTKTPTFR